MTVDELLIVLANKILRLRAELTEAENGYRAIEQTLLMLKKTTPTPSDVAIPSMSGARDGESPWMSQIDSIIPADGARLSEIYKIVQLRWPDVNYGQVSNGLTALRSCGLIATTGTRRSYIYHRKP